MEQADIVLDKKSFEALAADTRIKILKSLLQRRKTLTELASELNMSVSGVKEHLSTLEDAGLIQKIDDGHKWKYYELTKKGAGIVSPRQGGTRVMLILSLSLVAFVASMFMLLMPAMPDAQTAPLMAEAPMASKNGEVLVGGEQPYGAMEYIPTAMPAERWDDGEYYDAVMDVEGADAGVDSEAPPPAEPVPESGMSDETTTGDGGAEAAQAIHAEEPEAQSAEKKSEVPLPLVIAILSLATILLSVYELSRSGR